MDTKIYKRIWLLDRFSKCNIRSWYVCLFTDIRSGICTLTHITWSWKHCLILWVVFCLIQCADFHHTCQTTCRKHSQPLPASRLHGGASVFWRRRLQLVGRATPALLMSVWTIKSWLNLRPPLQVIPWPAAEWNAAVRGERKRLLKFTFGFEKQRKSLGCVFAVAGRYSGMDGDGGSCSFVSLNLISTSDLRVCRTPESSSGHHTVDWIQLQNHSAEGKLSLECCIHAHLLSCEVHLEDLWWFVSKPKPKFSCFLFYCVVGVILRGVCSQHNPAARQTRHCWTILQNPWTTFNNDVFYIQGQLLKNYHFLQYLNIQCGWVRERSWIRVILGPIYLSFYIVINTSVKSSVTGNKILHESLETGTAHCEVQNNPVWT